MKIIERRESNKYSIKLPLVVSESKTKKIDKFEDSLSQLDLVSNFFIYKFDNQNIYYRIIFNGTPKILHFKNGGFRSSNRYSK